jgi:drug/metabolite transporter (DMT)-like permease
LPFALLFYAGFVLILGEPPVLPLAVTVAWAGAGGLAQIAAPALLLAAMRSSAFVVAVAYSKTEPLLVLGVAWLLIGDAPTAVQSVGIVLATVAVVLLSWPSCGLGRSWLVPMIQGIGSGALFALSAVAYRAGIVSLPAESSFVMRASTTLVLALVIQTIVLSLWLRRFQPLAWRGLLGDVVGALPAGFAGAFASQLWFMAFALAGAPLVRTLALVEVPMSYVVSGRVFSEGVDLRRKVGLLVLCLGLAALLLGG